MFTSAYRFDYNTATVIPYHIQTSGHPEVHTMTILGIIRKHQPFEGMLALPGGFKDVETLEMAAKRELFEEINGIEELVKGLPIYAELITVQSDPNRDPRTQKTNVPVVDHVFAVNLPWEVVWSNSLKAADDAKGLLQVQYTKHKMPCYKQLVKQWAFDHGDSLWQFFRRIHWVE